MLARETFEGFTRPEGPQASPLVEALAQRAACVLIVPMLVRSKRLLEVHGLWTR
jgi:hypothetical protein